MTPIMNGFIPTITLKYKPINGSVIYIAKQYKKLAEKALNEPDPIKAAQMMIAHIDKKRAALGIDKARERVLYDMEMRRELDKV